MNYDFFMGQLRLIVIGFIAYLAGNGKLSTADASAATAILTPVGLIAGPWIWSIYRNLGKKLVPSDSVAVEASAVSAGAPVVGTTVGLNTAAKVVGMLLLGLLFYAPFGANAQTPKPRPTVQLPIDPLGLNAKINGASTSADPLENIIGALDAKLLPDLQYAKTLADASGSKVTAPCYGAWIDLINVRQKAVNGPDGQPLAFPDPGVISRFEQLVELRNALQPDSSFMIACSPVASMVKKDIVGFIGIVISGGAGLATLVPGL